MGKNYTASDVADAFEREVKRKVVTPEQYKQGWKRFLADPVPMVLVRKLPDGNYLVEAPPNHITSNR